MGRHLGIDFLWILVDLGGQDGAKLDSEIHPFGPVSRQGVVARGAFTLRYNIRHLQEHTAFVSVSTASYE